MAKYPIFINTCKLSFKNQYRLGYHIFTCPCLRHRCKLVPYMLDWLVQPGWLVQPVRSKCFNLFVCVFFAQDGCDMEYKTDSQENYLTCTHYSADGRTARVKPAGASCWAVSGCGSRPSTFCFLLGPFRCLHQQCRVPRVLTMGDSWHVVFTVQLS